MSERPRIIWDALLVRPEPTGVGRSILELARALSAEDCGCDFTVLVTHPEMFDFLEGAPHWRLRFCAAARGGVARKAGYTQLVLPRLVRRLRGDLLHSLQFTAPLALACPNVVTVHDLSFWSEPGTVEQPRRAYYRFIVPRSLRRAARILTNSKATAEEVAVRFPDLRDRITVTRFGTPSWVWRRPEVTPARAAAAPFLFVGTLEPRKNLPRLLAAYRLFLDRCGAGSEGHVAPDLVLVGAEGWRQSSLKNPIQELRGCRKVRWEGYCGHARLWELYSSARALLLPSLQEGFGFPILEAMAAGLPVLTSNRGAMKEVAGEAALLVDPESVEDLARGLTRLWSDGDLLISLSRRGRERARLFSWEGTARDTAVVYRSFWTGHGGSRPK
jgi:glycosyltransferase involved in cell wall biosynthesis